MRKKILLLCSVLLLFLCGCQTEEQSSGKNETDPEKEAEENEAEDVNKDKLTDQDKEQQAQPQYKRDSSAGKVLSATLDEMRQMMEEDQTFTVVFVKENCPYCIEFMMIFEDYIVDHNVTIYEINLSQENRTQNDNTMIIQTYFPEFRTTPGVFHVKDGEEMSYLNLYQLGMSEEILDSWVQEYRLDEKK